MSNVVMLAGPVLSQFVPALWELSPLPDLSQAGRRGQERARNNQHGLQDWWRGAVLETSWWGEHGNPGDVALRWGAGWGWGGCSWSLSKVTGRGAFAGKESGQGKGERSR